MATYFIHQKITAFANQYRIFEANGDQPGTLIAFAHQKRLALKEEIIFYTDESKQVVSFSFKARNIMELAGTYDVWDEHHESLGVLKKQFKQSLLRSTWHLHTPGQETEPFLIIQERSESIAIFRRIWSFIPFAGDLPFPAKYHFDFYDPTLKATIGAYEKITIIRDHYRLTAEDATLENIDWRVLVAQGVALDALQSR